MKKFLLSIILALSVLGVYAQAENESGKKLLFVYIAHDSNTPVQQLCDRLRSYYEEATIYEGNVTIFYLGNEDNPIVIEVNTDRDNRQDFDKFISELQNQNFHTVYPLADLQNIVNLFDRLNLATEDGKSLNYETADWFFYVTPRFWDNSYHEELVSRLCFTLGTEAFDMYKFQIKFYYPENNEIKINEEYPFGFKNYGNLNNTFYSYPY